MERLSPSTKRSLLPQTRNRRPKALRRATVAGLAAMLLGSAATKAEVSEHDLVAGFEQRVRSIFENCRKAVVRVEAMDLRGRLSGTGFFIDPNGTLYTSYSIGGEGEDLTVIFNEKRYPARRMIADLRSGIAILKIEAPTPFLVFGNSRDLNIASPVMTVGYAYDLPASPSFGMVAGREIRYSDGYFVAAHIRANLPVQCGQGGAPLLNLRGEAVGVLVAGLDRANGSYVLPIEAAEKVRRDFVRFQELRRGWLGVEVGTLEQPVLGSVAMVRGVLSDSPAQKAGITEGDVILAVGDRTIAGPDDVRDASFYLTAEDPVTVHLVRDNETLEVTVQPAYHPDDAGSKRLAPAFTPSPDLQMPSLTD